MSDWWSRLHAGVMKLPSAERPEVPMPGPVAEVEEAPPSWSPPPARARPESAALLLMQVRGARARELDLKVVGPTPLTDFPFRTGVGSGQRYEIEVDGQRVPISVASNRLEGKFLPTVNEIARSLAALPSASLRLIDEVVVEGGQNPDDAVRNLANPGTNFSSVMTASSTDPIRIYPTNHTQSEEALYDSLLHETGHKLSQAAWGAETDPRWDPWRAAIDADKGYVSEYSKETIEEDFAETFYAYLKVKGTGAEAELRGMLAHRIRLIDSLLAPPPT